MPTSFFSVYGNPGQICNNDGGSCADPQGQGLDSIHYCIPAKIVAHSRCSRDTCLPKKHSKLSITDNISYVKSFTFLISFNLYSNLWGMYYYPCIIIFKACLFWERVCVCTCTWVGEGQREGERENPKQALHTQCGARYGAGTHKPWNHDLSRSQTLNRLSQPDAPIYVLLMQKLLLSTHENGQTDQRKFVLCYQ